MIAFAKTTKRKLSDLKWHADFLKMQPTIIRHANIAFRFMPPEAREEAVAEIVALCCAAYARLVERKKQHVASASTLARFAVAQYRDGRRVTGRQSPRDAMSAIARYRKGFAIGQLDHFDRDAGSWREIVLEDRRAGPAETACVRIDFECWLGLLPRRQRRIALALATGETTSATARLFGVTAARISQLRLWLKESWETFQGEQLAAA